ncbi:hypothetical protein [Actinoplanes sp. NPDC051411]|uniref:hypothetical protein n=1 Tax=Actinoplanes sp. NPDC051411 TaxID=3155522 RepID=UPI0034453905
MAGLTAVVLYSPDCPNWREAGERLRAAMDLVGFRAREITFVAVSSDADAVATGFAGSPTFTVDGVDLFDAGGEPVGLTCRVYRTEAGALAGLPDVTALAAALRRVIP